MSSSILSHLAMRFSAHPENIATEALAYILHISSPARVALSAILSGFCTDTGSTELLYASQIASEDRSRPDLIGRDRDGVVRLILEAKFWAGLTEAQPTQYLQSLPAPGVLLFIAPEARLDLLWPELRTRLRENGLEMVEDGTELVRMIQVQGRTLALMSWRVLLNNLLAATENSGELSSAADVRQLIALCERMDTEAFLPLTSEELTAINGRRTVQFGELASSITDELVARGEARVKGLRAAAGNGWYGRYLILRGYGCLLYFSAELWAEWGQSPLWITIKEVKRQEWVANQRIASALQAAGMAFWFDEDGAHVPLRLPTGTELDEVRRSVLSQIGEIFAALPSVEWP
jgi:hypothetical protein